jgi:hypothetical protein
MCEHEVLRGVTNIARCGVHSRPTAGVQVWTWSAAAVTASCPCAVADRFVIAQESARGRWLAAADVVVASPRDSVSAAVPVADRLGRLPGCVLVFVPLVSGGAVLGRRTGHVVVPRCGLCPVCVYPWLACGGDVF